MFFPAVVVEFGALPESQFALRALVDRHRCPLLPHIGPPVVGPDLTIGSSGLVAPKALLSVRHVVAVTAQPFVGASAVRRRPVDHRVGVRG